MKNYHWHSSVNGLTSSSGFSLPQAYDGAEYTLLKGTSANSTHWTLTARCSGCTSYQGNDGEIATLNGTGTASFAWAQGNTPVQDPASNTSAFDIHQGHGKWEHDLNAARSSNFDTWVASNLLSPAVPVVTSSSIPAATTTSIRSTLTSSTSAKTTTLVTSVTSAKPTASATKGKIPASCSGAGNAKFSSSLASGWKATKVLGGLTSPRSIVFDSLGN